jgi:hypothetical protein
MIFAIQPSLIERLVFDAVRNDAERSRRYHRAFARCHEEPTEESRDRAFAALHETWFAELGFRGVMDALIARTTRVRHAVSRFMLTLAPGRGGQSVELFGAPGRYSVVMSVAPVLFRDEAAFCYWARHELMHVDDMLDPAFEYDIAHRPTGATPTARDLVRERYALMWGICIDARLDLAGHLPENVKPRRQDELARAFGTPPHDVVERVFQSLWNQFAAARPSHPVLMHMARMGLPELRSPDTAWQPERQAPGTPCPACRFPTFDWADREQLDALAGAVQADRAEWTVSDGLCGRCAELYRSRLPRNADRNVLIPSRGGPDA